MRIAVIEKGGLGSICSTRHNNKLIRLKARAKLWRLRGNGTNFTVRRTRAYFPSKVDRDCLKFAHTEDPTA
jgi:hypothetical protein